jgi:hypothetical protein
MLSQPRGRGDQFQQYSFNGEWGGLVDPLHLAIDPPAEGGQEPALE